MSEERRKVLEMLAAGKITPEDADRLLQKLSAPEPCTSAIVVAPRRAEKERSRAPKYIRVLVEDGPGERVNIRIPLGLVRAGLKIGAILPKGLKSKLCAEGVDLTGLSGLAGDELVEALCEMNIDIDSEGEGKVRIFCE